MANISLDLMNVEAVEFINKTKTPILPYKIVDGKQETAWNKKLVASQTMKGIVSGSGIPEISKGFGQVLGMNQASAVRNARTAVTSAENRGRYDAIRNLRKAGLKPKLQWLSTNDSRTRDSHAALNGEVISSSEVAKFSNGLRYPADPLGDPSEVYNCRCTLLVSIAGVDVVEDMQGTEFIAPKGNWEQYSGQQKFQALNKIQKKTVKKAIEDMDYQQKIDELDIEIKELSGNMQNKTYSGIWKDDVTLADYEAKKDSIQAKRKWFQEKIEMYEMRYEDLEDYDIKLLEKYKKYLKDLDDFEEKGKVYAEQLKKLEQLKKDRQSYQHLLHASPDDAYSEFRKQEAYAFGFNSGKTVTDSGIGDEMGSYEVLSPKTMELWRTSPDDQKRAMYEYTHSYHDVNETLRGIEYGTNSFKGVGNIDLDKVGVDNMGKSMGQVRKKINDMTDYIDKSTYDFDIWVNRGVDTSGASNFLNIDEEILRNGTKEDIENALFGNTVIEYGFMSCGSSKGTGFDDDVKLNIFCPSGTKMAYAEPFSRYGYDSKHSWDEWDGIKKQYGVGYENEVILQQSTKFRVIKVEKDRWGKVYIDLEVVGNGPYQK